MQVLFLLHTGAVSTVAVPSDNVCAPKVSELHCLNSHFFCHSSQFTLFRVHPVASSLLQIAYISIDYQLDRLIKLRILEEGSSILFTRHLLSLSFAPLCQRVKMLIQQVCVTEKNHESRESLFRVLFVFALPFARMNPCQVRRGYLCLTPIKKMDRRFIGES